MRQEVVERHVHEGWIAEEPLPIGHGEVHALDQAVEVFGGIVRQPLQPDGFDQEQRLEQGRALAPGAADGDLVAAPGAHDGRFDAGAVLGQVLHREMAALLLLEGHDLSGDVAAVEGVVSGAQPGGAVGGGAILVGHVGQGAGEVGLHEALAGLRDTAAGQEDGGVARVAGVGVLVDGDAVREQRVHREPFAGAFDRGGGDVGEAHGAVALERGDPGVGGRGHDGAEDALGDAAGLLEQIGRNGFRPVAETGDGLQRAVGEADHDRGHPGDVHQVRQQHAERDASGTPGVDRVAARLEDREAGGGGEVVPGGDAVPCAVEGGAAGGAHGVPFGLAFWATSCSSTRGT
jgi:hypothetical protein